MKKPQYYYPVTKQIFDECPWPAGKWPQGARMIVPQLLMDSAQHAITASSAARVLTDAEKRADRAQGYQDAFDHQRAANPCGRTMYAVSSAYADYCARLQAGAA